MVVVKILIDDELLKGEEFGAQLYENNFDGECEVQDDFHCIAEVDGRDTIFGSNDENVTIRLPLVRILAEQVVDDLCSRGVGNTYDEDLAMQYAQERVNDFVWRIADRADAMMEDHTTKDGLTIIDDVLKDCPHKCGDCIGTEYYGQECLHGCGDCGYFDGGNCIHSGSYNCGNLGGECAHDCYEWDNGE